MPSPFPGMDPWLEAGAVWPDVHHRLIDAMAKGLGARLRPRYFVGVEQRVYVLDDDDPAARRWIVPDAIAVTSSPRGSRARRGGRATRSPRVGAASVAPPTLVKVMPMGRSTVREGRLVIQALPSRQVVTAIELLSPTNKTAGSSGRREYLAKRDLVLESTAHLVEIDLLRGGARVPGAAGVAGDYLVHVSRVEERPSGALWACRLRDPLPTIPVPLRRGEPDATLDLGALLATIYDEAGYDLILDYDQPAEPPLPPADQRWARGLLRHGG